MRLARNLALLIGFVSAAAFADVKPGDMAPAFSLPGSDGKAHALADYAGKFVVLEWTNDGCPFVRKHYGSGNMQSLQKDATAQGAVWLTMVSSAPGKEGHVTAARAAQLTQERHASPTVVLLDESGNTGRAYGAKTTPHMFIVDKAGKVIYAGGIDSIASADADDLKSATPYVKVALGEALAGKPVSQASTRPYGCSIKY
jgi:hypothetical protein